MGLGLREGFWKKMEPEPGFKEKKWEKNKKEEEEEKISFFEKIKGENKIETGRNHLSESIKHYYFIFQKIKTRQNKHKRSVWLSP